MDILIKHTDDGSATLYNAALDEHYHSTHGALTESLHVFINHGFVPALATDVSALRILEVGLGTGLNAALTAAESETAQRHVWYVGLEPFPVDDALLRELGYEKLLRERQNTCFEQIHAAPWEETVQIHPRFNMLKTRTGISAYENPQPFHLIYFDAFAPEKQPDMWEMAVLEKCYALLAPGGIFVTYCAKGQFKRNLKQCGFRVERRPGPPGKREITFAVK